MDQELMRELRNIFIDEMSKRIEQLAHCVSVKDVSGAQQIAHKIHGTGGTYGFNEVSELGKSVETASKIGEWSQIQSGLSGLQTWLQKTNNTE